MSDQLSSYQPQPEGENEITLKDIIRNLASLLGSWPILLTGMVIGVVIAFVVNRYTADQYEVKATVARRNR